MKNWAYLFSHALAIGFALITAIWSWWLPSRSAMQDITIKELLKDSALDFATPIPWLGVIIFAWIFAVIKSEQFNKKLEMYSVLEDSFDLLERDFIYESDAHWDTKRNYYSSLCSSLKYILTSSNTGFSANCRVTVYRLHDADQKLFRNIFRHASQHRFDSNGRDAIPVNQGIVGLAYATADVRKFSTEKVFNSDEYWNDLQIVLDEANLSLPPKTTRMPSVHLIAKAITDHGTGRQIGVIVYESTDLVSLDDDAISECLTGEDQNISRFVSHLAKLDGDLNPFPDDAYLSEIEVEVAREENDE